MNLEVLQNSIRNRNASITDSNETISDLFENKCFREFSE